MFIEKSEPTGAPRTRSPSVTSTGAVEVIELLVVEDTEYLAIAEEIDDTRTGLDEWSAGRMGDPLQEVRMRILDGLSLQPSGAASSSNSNFSRQNLMSWWGTSALLSSTYARRWVMLPCPSSPLSPRRRRVFVRS